MRTRCLSIISYHIISYHFVSLPIKLNTRTLNLTIVIDIIPLITKKIFVKNYLKKNIFKNGHFSSWARESNKNWVWDFAFRMMCACVWKFVCVCGWVWVCESEIAGVPVHFLLFKLFSFPFIVAEVFVTPLKLDNNFAYDTTISGIRRGWVFALETVIVAEGHVLLWRQHLVLFHVLHVVGVRQAAYVVIWWICKLGEKGQNCLN